MYKNIVEINEAVELATNEDENEWIAYNTALIFDHVKQAWNKIQRFCNCSLKLLDLNLYNQGMQVTKILLEQNDSDYDINVVASIKIDDLLEEIDKIYQSFPKTFNQSFSRNFRDLVRFAYVKMAKIYSHVLIHQDQVDDDIKWNLRYFITFIQEFQIFNQNDIDTFSDTIFCSQIQ